MYWDFSIENLNSAITLLGTQTVKEITIRLTCTRVSDIDDTALCNLFPVELILNNRFTRESNDSMRNEEQLTKLKLENKISKNNR